MSSRHRWMRAVYLACLLALVGCGGNAPDVPDSGQWRHAYPVLKGMPGKDFQPGETLTALQLVARKPDAPETPGTLGTEHVSGGPARLVLDRETGEASLMLVGGGDSGLTIGTPGAPLPAFDLVLVRLRCLAPTKVSMVAHKGGKAVLRPAPLALNRSKDVQLVTFDVPRLREQSLPVEKLELGFSRPAHGVEVLSVDLLTTPPSRRLPRPGQEPAPLEVAMDTRMATGLVTGAGLICDFDVQDAHDELLFAVSQMPQVRAVGREPVVRVVLLQGDKVVHEEQIQLESKPSEAAAWHEMALPLGEYVGSRLRARFDLRVKDSDEAICGLTPPRLSRRGKDAPFVLLITSDTHRYDHVGSAPGAVDVQTPNLDKLAARGVLFADAWSTTNVTSPSHVALMTGLHPRDTRVLHNTSRMASRAETLAEAYHAAGYLTLGVVSVRHLGPNGTGLAQGFERMIAPPGEPWSAEAAADGLRDLIREADGQPVFAWLHVFDAHVPYEPPAEYADQYWSKSVGAAFDTSLPDPGILPGTIPRPLQTIRDLEYPKALYRGEVSYVDASLAVLLELPRAQSGLVAFTSDHGEILEKAGTYFNHGEVFPDTLHVPLILAGPDIPSGQVCEQPVRTQDLARSLLDLSGVAGSELPGRNLLYALEGQSKAQVRYSLSAHARSASITAIENGQRWHLILHLTEHGLPLAQKRLRHSWELYNLLEDPECLLDLSSSHAKVASDLRRRVIDWLMQASADPVSESRNATAESVAQLSKLGYAAGAEAPDDSASKGALYIDPDCICEACARASDG
ncbi:MAG: arylsulfatase A-like enzyme [Planctomycetota bacterium]|jgi:arylsulfatase A-like enzyme